MTPTAVAANRTARRRKTVTLLLMFFLVGILASPTWAANTLETRVATGNDDVEEQNGSMYRNSSDLELTHGDGHNQVIGIRFQNVAIPVNATILKAYIEFTVDETGNENGTLTIHGHDHDDSPSFSGSDWDVSDRTRTGASVSWQLTDDNRWTTTGAKKQTPELKTIVQEIVSRTGWNSGHAMTFIIDGTGKRVAQSYEKRSSKAPLLHVEYEDGPAAPIISVDPASFLGATCYQGLNAEPGSFELTNTGTATLDYSLTDDVDWLSCVTSCSGTLNPGETAIVSIQYDTHTMTSGSYTGHITISDTNAVNSPFEYDVNLLVQEAASGSTCGEVPIYAQNLVDPAILVLLDVSSSMNSMMPVASSSDNPRTPELKTIVQEIVNRSDWSAGNSMVFIINGTGKRVAESYDGVSSAAPLLRVTYEKNGATTSIETRVSATSDDAEERPSGSMYLDSSDLELIRDGSSNQTVGIRFQDVDIPAGATIVSADIEFVVDESDPTEPTFLVIRGENTGDARSFDAGTSYNISSRPPTMAQVLWNITDQWNSPPQKERYKIGREVISELVEDTTISWGYGTWAFSGYSGPGSGPNLDLLPSNPYGSSEIDLFTKIRAGIRHRNAADTAALKAIIESTTTTGGTPLGPSLLATREYFAGRKQDLDGNTYDSTLTCQPKFLIDVTDGLGYSPHTSVEIINRYTNLLADEKITAVAVGFGLDDATQLNEMARVSNERGSEPDLYALHEEDENGTPIPFMAQNQEELTAALRAITNSIKKQLFVGTSPAPSTSVQMGNFVINASFNAADWSGNVTAAPYDPETGVLMMCVDSAGNRTCDPAAIVGRCPDSGETSCNPADIEETECVCWDAAEVMPMTKNAWTVAGDLSHAGIGISPGEAGHYTDDHTSLGTMDIALDGDNYLCKDLGDVINSTPTIVGPPGRYYFFDNYRFFRLKTAAEREPMLYVGANDGALHALNLQTGVESWRFYPEAVHAKLIDAGLCEDGYCHNYFVDGTPTAADIYLGSGHDVYQGSELRQTGWRTILITGLGRGGSAYFALDITSGSPFAENNTDPLTGTTYLWQFTDDELGLTISRPAVARINLPDTDFGGWGAFFGSGYDEDGGPEKEAYVYGIDAYGMTPLWLDSQGQPTNRVKIEESDRISYSGQIGDEFVPGQTVTGKDSGASGLVVSVLDDGDQGELVLSDINGSFSTGELLQVGSTDMATLSLDLHSQYASDALSDPLAADLDFDHLTDALYFGSLYGRLYRLTDIAREAVPQVSLLFALDPLQVNHNTPIRAGASLGYDAEEGTVWLYFGTGRFEEQSDKFNTEQQYFIALKDNLNNPVSDSSLADLLERTAVAVTATVNGEEREYRIMTGYSYAYQGTGTPVVGRTMEGVRSHATGTIESLSTLGSTQVVTFAGSSLDGTFLVDEELFDQSDDSIRITLKGHPWYARLHQVTGVPSERVVSRALVAGGVVFFTSFIPDDDVCGGNGSAWLYALDFQTGLPPADVIFDINGDGAYDSQDKVTTSSGEEAAVAAIPIGRGIPSAPVLEGNMIFVNTTDLARPGLPVNLPALRASISSWKDDHTSSQAETTE